MSQEAGLRVGQSSFQNQRPSGCYREGPRSPWVSLFKEAIYGTAAPGEKKNGFLRPQLLRLLACRFTCLPAGSPAKGES